MSSCLIIGGGVSGLIAAKALQEREIYTTVLDKGRGIGGRLATRRLANSNLKSTLDYGAPHFQVTDPKFRKIVNSWQMAGIVKEWNCGDFINSSEPFYVGVESNRAIAQYLAKDLNIYTETRIVSIQSQENCWLITSETGDTFEGDTLLITAPVPQSLDLLDASNIAIPLEIRHGLDKVNYHRCIAVLALLDKASQIQSGVRLDGDPLAWIGCDRQNSISPSCNGVTIHASKDFSLANWDDRDIVAKQLLDAAKPWLGAEVVRYQVHGWKFSQPATSYGESYATFATPGTVVLAGDAFSAQRNVEGAVLSGLAAAEYIFSSRYSG